MRACAMALEPRQHEDAQAALLLALWDGGGVAAIAGEIGRRLGDGQGRGEAERGGGQQDFCKLHGVSDAFLASVE